MNNSSMERLAEPVSDQNPLILVPGFLASQLWTVPRLLLSPPVLAWPLNPLSLTAQLYFLRASNRLAADGLVKGYYESLIEFIGGPVEQGGLGRRGGEDFWVFPYDWRQSSRQTGKQLSQFITDKLAQFNLSRAAQGRPALQKVDLINHSLGGFVARAAIKLYQAPVERVVYIASPHHGVVKAYFALHPDLRTALVDEFITGFVPGLYWNWLKTMPNVVFTERWLMRLLADFPSLYELLPDRFYFEGGQNLLVDTTRQPSEPVRGLEETYYRHEWQLPLAQQARVREAMNFKEELGPDLPEEQNLVIYADSLPTPAQTNFSGRLEHPRSLAIGDGTVTAPSAAPGDQAQGIIIEGLHSKLPSLPATHRAIRDFLVPDARTEL